MTKKHMSRKWTLATILLTLLLSACGGSTALGSGKATPTSSSNGQIVNTLVATTGCGKNTPVTQGKTTKVTITSGGLQRTYLLHVPVGYNSQQKIPLVLNIHGLNEMAGLQEQYTQYSVLADQEHFIVVYPQGIVGPKGKVGWATYGRIDPTSNDVLFFSDLLTTLQKQLCIDPRRIYATGISNGGGMTNLLACQLSGRIAAFAAIAPAVYPIPGGCHPSRPVAYLEFHGTSDPIVKYTGAKLLDLPPVMQTLQAWAQLDGCSSNATTFFQQADVTGLEWSNCQAGVIVEHYRIAGGGHTWPGTTMVAPQLGTATHTISATTLSWQFFQKYQLPAS